MEAISLQQYAHGHLVGARATATPLREELEARVLRGEETILDFAGVQATQSFIDELLGVLVLRHGPDILGQIILRSCSADVKGIIEFVLADRYDQYLKTRSH